MKTYKNKINLTDLYKTMTKDIIETIERGTFKINIYPEYDYDYLNDDGMGELHLISRNYKHDVSWSDSLEAWDNIIKDNWVIAGSYGEHSCIWLNGYGVLLNNDIEKAIKHELKEAKKDLKKDFERYEVMWSHTLEQFDDYDAIILVSKDVLDKKHINKNVSSIWRYHDDVLRGNVYWYQVVDKDGDFVDSCCGFVGGDCVESGLIDYATSCIPDSELEYYNKKYKKQADEALDKAKSLLANITV